MQNDNTKLKTRNIDTSKRVFLLALRVIKLVDLLPKDTTSQIIGKQLLRSATSVGANVVEAKGASSRKDFTNFFSYALKSANETIFWIELLKDSNKARGIDLLPLLGEVKEVANILASSILTLKGRKAS